MNDSDKSCSTCEFAGLLTSEEPCKSCNLGCGVHSNYSPQGKTKETEEIAHKDCSTCEFVGILTSKEPCNSCHPDPMVHSNYSPRGKTKETEESKQVGGNHYSKYAIEPIEFFNRNNIPFNEASAMKYIIRHKDKNGMEDLRKAKQYLEFIAKYTYNETL